MSTTLRLFFLLMLGLFGLQPVGYGYDAPVDSVSGTQTIVAATPESQAATAETAAPVPLNFNRTGAAWDSSESIGLNSNFVAGKNVATSAAESLMTDESESLVAQKTGQAASDAAEGDANAVASANKGADTASTAAPEGTAAAPESAGTDAPATAGDTPAAAPEPPPEPVTDTPRAPTAEPSVGASDPVADAPTTPEAPVAAEETGSTVLSGHGALVVGDSSPVTILPQGTSLTFWTEHGNSISDALGNAIETGGQITVEQFPEAAGARSYLPGSVVPNYTLYPPTGLNILGNPTTVTSPTSLSSLLQPGMGNVNWAACRGVIAP